MAATAKPRKKASAAPKKPAGHPASEKKERPKTYKELVSDQTPWDMNAIARELGVQYQTVKSWRRDYRRTILRPTNGTHAPAQEADSPPHPKLLPPPDGPKVPDELRDVMPARPLWRAGTIRKWAMQTGRMTEEGVPIKGKPPGRPKRST